ncbi:MAG: tRNA (adenosine(37)-N6)-threonylcarbamoyltransferase complex dimerization subunit type 1 TsaB, partial [Bdellovibrionales bacterium]
MWSLAIESSTQVASVALFNQNQVVSNRESRIQRSHSENLNSFVNDLLEESKITAADLKLISVGVGPGSFTGIRVSINLAKTLSYSCSIPIAAVNSLEALALPYVDQKWPVLSLINAYKNMSYYAVYMNGIESLNTIHKPHVIPMIEIKKIIDSKHLVIGDGYLFYEKLMPESLLSLMIRPTSPEDFPMASTIGKIGLQKFEKGQTFDWKSLSPLY